MPLLGKNSADDPSSYRPLCLLDVEGKLFEHIMLARLKKELERTGGLAERQYGFREKRQTVDAIADVLKIAKQAWDFSSQNRKIAAVITLDVRNAFNSASWQIILDKLRKRKIDENLLTLIASYLSEREIIVECEGTTQNIEISSGVPQGSVLGPTLWNILYDDLLRMELPRDVTLIGFADDIAMVVVDKIEEGVMEKANMGILMISNWMDKNCLRLAPEKTEAVLLTKRTKMAHVHFNIQGMEIAPKASVKYLGVWLDSKLTFSEHIRRTLVKVEKTVSALSCLMPNVGGPQMSKRKMLATVAQSQILYAAPIWHTVTSKKGLTRKLLRIQRLMSIRVISAYRTISAEAAGIIGGIPPIDLLIEERWAIYNGADRKTARESLNARWQERWTTSSKGRWTHKIIPEIAKWLNGPCLEADYYLTQALSGHGCFNAFLYKRKKSDTDLCPYCGKLDDAEHTLFHCSRWGEIRVAYRDETHDPFNLENLSRDIVNEESTWRRAYTVIRKIIETKEREVYLFRP